MVEIEYAGGNYCAYAPLLPGCVSTGNTLNEIKRNIKEAIELHVEGSIEDGEEDLIPEVFKGEYGLVYKLSDEVLKRHATKIRPKTMQKIRLKVS